MDKLRLFPIALKLSLLILLAPVGVSSAPAVGLSGGWQAAWSPDGERIVFASGLPHSSANIWVANTDGKAAIQLTKRGGQEPVWTADGREIIFRADRGLGARYYSVPADGSGEDKLYEPLPSGAAQALWSPDGKQIVYELVADGKLITHVLTLATGEKRQLQTELAAKDYCWSPDSRRLAVVTGVVVGDSLLEYDLSTDKIEHVYHGYCSSPSYSPDGKLLAFAIPLGKNRHRPIIITLGEKKDRKLELTEFDGRKLSWSKDGRKLLFSSATRGEPSRIWTVASEGGKPKAFKSSYQWAGQPQYSPVGSRVLYEAVVKNGYGTDLYVCGADGSNAKRLTTTGRSYWQPRWSSSGKLVVLSNDGGSGHVLLVDQIKGSKKQIGIFAVGQPARVSFSPLGDRVAVVQGGMIALLDPAAKPVAAKALVNSRYPTTMSWSPDGKTVYYTEARKEGVGISSIGVDGQNRAMLTSIPQAPANPHGQPADNKASPHKDAGSESVPGGGEVAAPEETTDKKAEQPQPPTIDICPAVCPDGKSLVFVRGVDLWFIGTDGSGERLLAKSDAGADDVVSYPNWSGDGKSILFQLHRKTDDGVQHELWTVNVDGTDPKRVYQSRVNSQFEMYVEESTNPPQFTPDGNSVILTMAPSGTPEVSLLELATGQLKQLTQTGGAFPALSPDGKHLAYTSFEGGRETIRILDMLTGSPTPFKLAN